MPRLTEAQKQRNKKELEMSLGRLHIPNVTHEFTVTQIPGKGQGVIATMDIPRGTLLVAETALFFVDNVGDHLSGPNKRTIEREAKDNSRFRDLFCTADPPSDESRFETNNFEVGDKKEGKSRCGIFVEASRFNHSCVPNAYCAWNPELNNRQGQLTIYAIQDIYAGEEILINYHTEDSYDLRDTRQAGLHDDYGFICNCPACLRQPGYQFGAMSDGRRGRMRDLQREIHGSTHLRTPEEREAKRGNINKLIDTLRQEGIIYPQLAGALDELGKLAYHELRLARNRRDVSAAAYESYCYNSALQIARDKLDLDVCCTGFRSPVVMAALEFIRSLDR